MSTLGQNRDVPQEKFAVICKPWQPTERQKQEGKGCDHVARACSAHTPLADSEQLARALQNQILPTASGQAFSCPSVLQLDADTCHSHSELH